MRSEQDAAGDASVDTNTDASPLNEKRHWFHSFTRRQRNSAQVSSSSSSNDVSHVPQHLQQTNNNNPPAGVQAQPGGGEEAASPLSSGKRKDEKNVFQRLRRKIGLRFSSLRHRNNCDESEDDDDDDEGRGGATTDASSEFLTHSPRREAQQLSFSFSSQRDLAEQAEQPEEELLFTHDYKRFVVKKWLEQENPNRVMYKASSEMLSQVWYWGEISRRDAQKQLTDKPTGSFLVRDSETSGCQFTLSFRIVNVTLHYRLEYRDNNWLFEELKYDSIVRMIEDILYRCTNDNYICFVKVPNEMQPQFPVILKYPLSRYSHMPNLQDLCRRAIQRHSAQEEIAQLPIPPKLLEYLAEKRELVFQS